MAAIGTSNPTFGAEQAPTFGGLTGYRRDVTSKPTAVPGSLPANRGNASVPGRPISTPTIQASYNRHDRGTNNVVSYSRVVDAGDVDSYGRTSPGDVVFTNRGARGPGYGPSGHTRVVGIDWLNTQLGGRPMWEPDKHRIPAGPKDRRIFARVKHGSNWRVGHNVLLRKSGQENFWADKFNLEWRLLHLLQEWRCDGVVLSDDLPGAHVPSSAERESQLFNIAVQGVCLLNNGYCDINDKAVESNTRIGNGGNGRAYNQPNDPYSSSCKLYPKQMFDRDVFCGSDVFVGLVATPRNLNDKMSEHTTDMRFKDSTETCSAFFQRTHGKDAVTNADTTFYTFHYALFTSRQLMEFADLTKENKYSGTPHERKLRTFNRKVHPLSYALLSNTREVKKADGTPEHVNLRNLEPDPFSGPSFHEFRGMVGAWRIGKCIDAAARRKPSFAHGPYDTIDQISVNVCVEFYTLEQLINISYEQVLTSKEEYKWVDKPDIGRIFSDVYAKPPNKDVVDMQWDHALKPGKRRYNALEYMQWPTHVEQAPGAYAEHGVFSKGNLRDGFMFKGGEESERYRTMALYLPSAESKDGKEDTPNASPAVGQKDMVFHQKNVDGVTSALALFKAKGKMYPKQVRLRLQMIVAVNVLNTAMNDLQSKENAQLASEAITNVINAYEDIADVLGDIHRLEKQGNDDIWEVSVNHLKELLETFNSKRDLESASAIKEFMLNALIFVKGGVDEARQTSFALMNDAQSSIKKMQADSKLLDARDEILSATLQGLIQSFQEMLTLVAKSHDTATRDAQEASDEYTKLVSEQFETIVALFSSSATIALNGLRVLKKLGFGEDSSASFDIEELKILIADIVKSYDDGTGDVLEEATKELVREPSNKRYILQLQNLILSDIDMQIQRMLETRRNYRDFFNYLTTHGTKDMLTRRENIMKRIIQDQTEQRSEEALNLYDFLQGHHIKNAGRAIHEYSLHLKAYTTMLNLLKLTHGTKADGGVRKIPENLNTSLTQARNVLQELNASNVDSENYDPDIFSKLTLDEFNDWKQNALQDVTEIRKLFDFSHETVIPAVMSQLKKVSEIIEEFKTIIPGLQPKQKHILHALSIAQSIESSRLKVIEEMEILQSQLTVESDVGALPPRSANLPPASPAKPSDETTLSGTLRQAFPSLAPAQDAFASLFGTETVVSSAPPVKAPVKPPAKPPAAAAPAAAAPAASSSSIGASASEQPPSDHDFLVVPSNRPAPPTAPVNSDAPKKRGVSPGKKPAARRRTD